MTVNLRGATQNDKNEDSDTNFDPSSLPAKGWFTEFPILNSNIFAKIHSVSFSSYAFTSTALKKIHSSPFEICVTCINRKQVEFRKAIGLNNINEKNMEQHKTQAIFLRSTYIHTGVLEESHTHKLFEKFC